MNSTSWGTGAVHISSPPLPSCAPTFTPEPRRKLTRKTSMHQLCTCLCTVAPLVSLLKTVIRRFFCNNDIVDMTFSQAPARYLNESGLFLQITNGLASDIPHACPETAQQLMDTEGKGTPIRYPALDPFGDQLSFLHIPLGVSILTPLTHGLKRTHAPVDFIAA